MHQTRNGGLHGWLEDVQDLNGLSTGAQLLLECLSVLITMCSAALLCTARVLSHLCQLCLQRQAGCLGHTQTRRWCKLPGMAAAAARIAALLVPATAQSSLTGRFSSAASCVMMQ